MESENLELQNGSNEPPKEATIVEEGDATLEKLNLPAEIPVLPLRNSVLFPGTISPLSVGRASTLEMLEQSLPHGDHVVVVLQKDPEKDDVGLEDLHEVGCLAKVLRLVRPDQEAAIVISQGIERVKLVRATQTEPFLKVEVERLVQSSPEDDDEYWTAAVRNLRESAIKLLEFNPNVPPEAITMLSGMDDPATLSDFLAGNLSLELNRSQDLMSQLNVVLRVENLQKQIDNQLRIAEIQQKLRSDVETEFTESQKRAYLREQLRAIQKELGEQDGTEEEVEDLRERLDAANLPEEAREQADHELKRLEIIPPQSPDHSVILNYLETLAELPWEAMSKDNLDLNAAQEKLDQDHYGLKRVKQRIIEFLAVRKLNPTGQGPILCFVGPPGVGKTSLGESIADALGREFTRMALGGIRDESEIRGHRRTYIGSMPGRIIQELRRVGTRNPVMMLDEVDKMGADFRGDPASALLEVLDPRQNDSFSDRYLDVPFDLSQVMFIATANTLSTIPAPLLDRMETIELPGYTEEEKLNIATRYLIPRQIKENGLKEDQCTFEEKAIRAVISDYTRESGVRNLERELGSVCRSVAARVAKEEITSLNVDLNEVRHILGPAKFVRESKLLKSQPGVVTGLAYTQVGGDVLHVEAIRFPGKGNVKLTGQLGDVMKESVQAAQSLVRSRAKELKIKPADFENYDVHIHVPAGAVPKDGPSAGITMFTALASLYANRSVNHEVAMTGEITLRGLVLPIGGLKEKTIAALTAGIKKVIIPKLNEKDIPELPEEVRERLEIVPVETVDEVLRHALV
tara:strand:- start:7199 stop:9604 length:2406 start_codon:yes stop_codon:yes gene_type:complete